MILKDFLKNRMGLPVNIEDLLSRKTIETDRIEFKEGWNPDSIYRSVCAVPMILTIQVAAIYL